MNKPNVDPVANPSPASTVPPVRTSSTTKTVRFSDQEIATARNNITRAIELRGLVDDEGNAICPECGRSGRGKVRIFPEVGAWHCFSSNWCNSGNGRAIDLLVNDGWPFADAVAALLGRPHGHTVTAKKLSVVDAGGFAAAVDSDVYERVISLGSEEAAIEFYARWHISADAVRELGTSMIVDIKKMKATLLNEFSLDRLAQCGLVRPSDESRREYWTVNEHYPVLEPHRSPDGRVVGLQARASVQREARYRKHLDYSKARRAAEEAGETFRAPNADERYVGKFSSLRGGQPGLHLVGAGLPRLATLPVGSTVFIVEGVKDLLAMRSLKGGFEAYALPGVGVTPPPEAMNLLRKFNLRIAFDADAGGDVGAKKLAEHLARAGVISVDLGREWALSHPGVEPLAMAQEELETRGLDGDDLRNVLRVVKRRRELKLRCVRHRPPEGSDAADVLAREHTMKGCNCPK